MQSDARAVDPVEQVEADVGLPSQVQRLVDQRAGLGAPALVQRDFGQALQLQRLADAATDRAVQPRALAQMLARCGQVAGQPFGFAAQRGAEGVAARRA